jgi:hypothetical protein
MPMVWIDRSVAYFDKSFDFGLGLCFLASQVLDLAFNLP